MPDHEHSTYATRSELNGFGGRVDSLKERVASQEAKVERTERDVSKIFDLVEDVAKTTQAFEVATQKAIGEMRVHCERSVSSIDTKVSNLKWWTLGGLGALGFAYRAIAPILSRLVGE